jgi:hypothetical protein
MTTRLPFTLTPLEGEPLELWLHAYATRLGVTISDLAAALGLPDRLTTGRPLRPALPSGRAIEAICEATGLTSQAVTRLLQAPGHTPPLSLLRAWAPQPASRYCPACLARNAGRMDPDWRFRLAFFCLRHDRPLAAYCPHCQRGRPTPGPRPGTTDRPATGHPTGCGHQPGAARPPACPDPAASRQAQQFINRLLTGLRDPGGTPASRQDALDTLTDITLTAVHLATMARPRLAKEPRADLLRADTLTTAVTLITHDCQASSPDPLARLAAEHNAGQPARAIPPSWRPASPGLRTRIARARATTMTPAVQLRHATTLARPRQLPPRARAGTDPAISRAARLPDQIWPAWAIRLTDTGQVTATAFASSALIALLLPHSTLNLETGIIPLTGTPTSPDTIRNHLAMLARGPHGQAPLRILTELAFAIDDHQIPIDYARRRQLTATTELISDHAWKTITSSHPGQRAGHARRYLYELITGSNPSTAPAPYRPPSSDSHHSYRQFAALLHEPVARALHDHALGLLRNAGITGEPLTWQPPVTWTTVTTWPGKDPDQTDPAPIHAAILSQHLTPQQAAEAAGISLEHLRVVLRRHPLPRPVSPPRPRRHSITAIGPGSRQAGHPPHARTGETFRIDPDWLRDEYITWQRSMPAIARQLGCHPATLTKFARASGIPLRPPGGSTRHIATTAPGHPASLPEPLRSALTGLKATQRLERFLHIASHHGISRTARDLHISRGALGRQIAILERACGSLFLRPAPTTRLSELTPLGEQLRQQATDYLSRHQPPPGQ